MEEDSLKEPYVQTADKITRLTQDLAKTTKMKKEILEVKHKSNVPFLDARKIVGTYMGENSFPGCKENSRYLHGRK